ncbi:YggS family pyridoxal phosphate-dependent enzyme [Robiginitalea aurantiaca]|uniref:Pyridoxal phosphate homeostasis protein n=1 Tax=Robiginitalea aurantiaca TaxID=3056915 RepID=A0ABT7WG85_9FLAO|nr:YggS family pyridoxal phosphate-dependent enzyme [Robiginitalea aurantiaca]MDM9631935.1 YggS family pyridoxal phosphate-dependent enzyme [Robiginitalea aurantiaca]
MSISEKLQQIVKTLPPGVTLVAVSKTKSEDDIMKAYTAGQRVFGENKVQELVGKWEVLPKDIQWHMIGHLQRNKVKYIAGFVTLIHGVDSLRLLREINKRAAQADRIQDCLLQVHIASESTKFGFDQAEIAEAMEIIKAKQLPNIRVRGLMGMATFTEDQAQVRGEFRFLKSLFDALGKGDETFNILSMGMSGDYLLAIEEGSTMVRLGSSIFGSRNTP